MDNMDNMDNNIFYKTSEKKKINNIYVEDVFSTIPKNSTTIRDIKLIKNHTEWRWRFYQFNKLKKVEISNISPTSSKRLYLNNNGIWVERIIDPKYDKYIIKTYYYYAII